MEGRLQILQRKACGAGGNLKVVSLFSGCGGLDTGFTQVGFEVLAAYEADARTTGVYNQNLTNVARRCVLDESSNIGTDADVVLATPPCQGFSTAGGYQKNDPRNDLLAVAAKLIVSANPRIAVIENVAALGNSRNRDVLKNAIETLSNSGFTVNFSVLEAERLGVPQRRRRMFIVARQGAAPFNFGDLGQGPICCSLENALAGLDQGHLGHNPKYLSAGSNHEKIAKRIGQGQKLCNVRVGGAAVPTWEIPEVFGVVLDSEREVLEIIQRLRRTERVRRFGDADPVPLRRIEEALGRNPRSEIEQLMSKGYLRRIDDKIDLTNTFNGKYRRLRLDDVSPTVDTRFGDFRLFLHPTQNRGMTVREAARIQGFDDKFIFDKDERIAFKQVGNAVPPPVGRAVAEFVRALL
ncbi:DNA cytosine methyltransferase [Rhizobium leguminosarum]